MLEALFWEKMDGTTVRCSLCRHRCLLNDGARGICGVRQNRSGRLYPLSAGLLVAEHIDPVEKKPLYHLLPGSRCYSVASVGCNFRCLHCQNADIAQVAQRPVDPLPGRAVPAADIVRQAQQAGCQSIACTYTEPTVWFEYTLEIARLAAVAGLRTIYVTNGYITPEALNLLAPVLHAANIDLKGFSDSFYRRVCGARLSEVLDTIRDYRRHGIWIELTTLVIPGENDDAEQLNGIARFIAEELGPDTPWHISRFFPCHRMTDHPPTPVASLERALEAGERYGLRYLYLGNISHGHEQTRCPSCGSVVVNRQGYTITGIDLKNGACSSCGTPIAGIWA